MKANYIHRLLNLAHGEGLRAQLVRGAMGVGMLKFLSLPLTFAASILLARALGPAGFGQYAFIMSLVTVLSLPLDKGMRQLVTREVSGYHHEQNWALFNGMLRRAHQWVIVGFLIITLILGGTAAFRAAWTVDDRWTLLLVGLLILPFLSFNALRGATLRGLGYVVQAQIPEMLAKPGFHLTIAAMLLLFGLLNPATALLSQAAAAAIAFAIGAVLLRRHSPPQIRTTEPAFHNKEWACAWVPFTLLMAASLLNNQIGILLLGWLGTDEQVAALRVADRGAHLVAFSLNIVNLVIAPYITRAYREGNKPRMQQLSRQSARAALAVALPIALPLIFFGAPIVSFVFGADYIGLTVMPLAVLAAAQLINVGFGSVGMFLTMSGFERDTLFGQVVALALNAVACLILIPRFGANGAAYSAAIGLITWNVVLGLKFIQRLKLRPTAI